MAFALQAKFQRQLRQMSMEEIQKLKEGIGLKLFNRKMGVVSQGSGGKDKGRRRQDFKRENKNRPREMSSKKTVKRLRDVVGLKAEQRLEKRDPRFDNLCGEFDEKVRIYIM